MGFPKRRQLRLNAVALTLAFGLLGGFAGPAAAQGGPIMPLSQVTPGMMCTGYTVIQGTTISSFNVQVLDILQAAAPGGGPGIYIQVSGPAVAATGVAEGFSGSPILCPGPGGTMETAGAISEGLPTTDDSLAIATPIQAMLGEPVKPPAGAPVLRVRVRDLTGPLTVRGLSPALFAVFQAAAKRAGRTVLAAPAGPLSSFPVQPLIPGASVGVSYSTGALVAGAGGTVTYVNGPDVYAFGHPFDGAGRRSLFLQDAYVDGIVPINNSPLGSSYKLLEPGHTEGTLTSDTPNAVIGVTGAPPPSVPVNVRARDLDTGQRLSLQSRAADETNVGLPLGSSIVDALAPAEVGQAALAIYNGAPADETGSMCLRIYIREIKGGPLGFCNRYAGTGPPGAAGLNELAISTMGDVGTAFSYLEQEQFATLHVTKVLATVNARRGLEEASILSAKAPRRVKAGQRVSVRVTLRLYRGPLKHVTFQLGIPRHARGIVVARVMGDQAAGFGLGGIEGLLGGLIGGPSFGPQAGPRSAQALRQAIAGIAQYPGITYTIGRRRPKAVYASPRFLVTGFARLVFLVGQVPRAKGCHPGQRACAGKVVKRSGSSRSST
jgi:hypothetical protein